MENMTATSMTILIYGFTIVISLLIALLIKIMAALLAKFSKPSPIEEVVYDNANENSSQKDVEIAIAIALAKNKK